MKCRLLEATLATLRTRHPNLLEQCRLPARADPAEKEAIYNLRYRAYLREGAVKESARAARRDRYEDLPNTWTFGVFCSASSAVRSGSAC